MMNARYGLANALGNVFTSRGNDGGIDAYAKGQLVGSQMANYQSQADEHNKNAAIKQRQLDLMSDDELFKSSLATQGVNPKYNQLANEFRTTGLWGPNQTFDDASAPPQIQAMHPVGGVPAAMPDDLFMKDAGLRRLYADYGNSRKSVVDGRSTAKDIAEATNISLGQVFDMGSNGMIYGKYTGGVDMSNPTNQLATQFINAKTATELAQGRNYDASTVLNNAKTQTEYVDAGVKAGKGFDSSFPYQGAVNEAARITGLDPLLIKSVIGHETSFGRNNVKSSEGARGLMQVMPENMPYINRMAGRVLDMSNPNDQVLAGSLLLADFVKKNNGNIEGALANYHHGYLKPGDKGYGPASAAYVPNVMGIYNSLRSGNKDKSDSLALPDVVRDKLKVYRNDGGQMGNETVIDLVATQKKEAELINAYNQSGGGMPFAQFAMQYNGQGAKPAPQAQPQAAPRLSQQQELQLAQDAIAKGAPAQAVFDAMRQRGIDPSPLMPKPAAKPVAQQRENPQPAAPQAAAKPVPALAKPFDNGWKDKKFSDGSEKAKMPVINLPSFGLHGDPNAGRQFGPQANQRDAQAQQIVANLLAKQFMFGG